jgi:hypothetical protein
MRTAGCINKNLSIKNKGNADLIITSVTVDNQLFVVEWAGQVVIPPNKSYKIRVTFTPVSAGIQAGVLTIASNDDHSPTPVTLSGEGK